MIRRSVTDTASGAAGGVSMVVVGKNPRAYGESSTRVGSAVDLFSNSRRLEGASRRSSGAVPTEVLSGEAEVEMELDNGDAET